MNIVETQNWAEQEFGNADLGDYRRTKRLIQLAGERGAQPHASFSQSCEDDASTKAAYRFYENEAIHPIDILSSHRESTETRMSHESIVLAVQDTTQLDYTHHPATEGLGVLQTKKQHGMLMHTTLAVTPERVPLGIIEQQTWIRPAKDFGKKHQRKKRPTSEKESQKWLTSLEAAHRLQQKLPQTRIVSVGDREADIYDLFSLSEQLGQSLLVRAAWNRCVDHPENYLWSFMESQPVAGTITVTVPRKGNQPARQAELTVRFGKVTICPPRSRASEGLKPIILWGILACEEHPPLDIKPTEAISWLLLTKEPVNTFQDACEKLQWYTCRWLIEIYHKVLKDGCRVEERQFEDAENIKRYLALDSVVGWRVLYLTMIGRQKPDLPCSAILEAHEWQALYCFIHKTITPPEQPPSLRQAIRWIGKLGGFMGRKGDGEPGVTVLWRGLQRLYGISETWLIFHPPLHESRDVGKD